MSFIFSTFFYDKKAWSVMLFSIVAMAYTDLLKL